MAAPGFDPMFHNFCPHCGKPLPAAAFFCPFCHYKMGDDLRQIDASRPMPDGTPDIMSTDEPYVEPSLPMKHLGLPTSAWDGKVHNLVSADGQYKWDGHMWVSIAHQLSPDGFWRWDGYNWVPSGRALPPTPGHPGMDAHLRDAVADTKPIKKGGLASGMSPRGWVVAILAGAAFTGVFLWFIFSLPSGGIVPGGGTWYVHYNCGGDSTCISLQGVDFKPDGNTGLFSTESDQASCQDHLRLIQNAGVAQSYWCSQSSNPAAQGS